MHTKLARLICLIRWRTSAVIHGWLATYLQELLVFPRPADQVDSTSQALAWLTTRLNQARF
jgi:phage terminase large subunit-like protein